MNMSRSLLAGTTVALLPSSMTPTAFKAYAERADIARRRGVQLLYCEPTEENLRRIHAGDPLRFRYWNGKSMDEREEPAPKGWYDRSPLRGRQRDFYNSFWSSISARGALFVNERDFRYTIADKWNAYQFFDEHKFTTPKTSLFAPDALHDMLQTYGTVRIKRRRASQGKGQYVVLKNSGQGVNIQPDTALTPIAFGTLGKALDWLLKQGVDDQFLVQEKISSDTIAGHAYDIRAVFQRNEHGRLGMTGAYIRVAYPRSRQANIHKSGHPHAITLSLNDEGLERDIKDEGAAIAEALTESRKFGRFGEIGLDFLYDEDRYQLIAIELNSLPGGKGFRELASWQPTDERNRQRKVLPILYDNETHLIWEKRLQRFLINPVLYAAHLATSDATRRSESETAEHHPPARAKRET